MAGTLITSTIQGTTLTDGTNSTSTTNCIQGSAKAWVNFNGTGTVAIRASYNVSSITDNGTGDYTVNFTNALSNANYSSIGTAGYSTSSKVYLLQSPYNAVPTTTALRVAVTGDASNPLDAEYVNVSVFSS